MIRMRNVFFLSILFALLIGGGIATAQEKTGTKLQNGFYPVSGEGATRSAALTGTQSCVALVYDGKYVDSTQMSSPQYIAVDTSSFVPLILQSAPTAKKDGNGRTLLGVTLSKKYVRKLEDFTKAHLGAKVAIVLDGEIITMHKIRSVISEGKVQISRCYDNACEILLSKLAK
jgi:preprotein translocase subunit SecD